MRREPPHRLGVSERGNKRPMRRFHNNRRRLRSEDAHVPGKSTGIYFMRVLSHTEYWKGKAISAEAFLDYSTPDLCIGIDGRDDLIARRARQLAPTGTESPHTDTPERTQKGEMNSRPFI